MLANASIQSTTTLQGLPLCAALDELPAYVAASLQFTAPSVMAGLVPAIHVVQLHGSFASCWRPIG
jgi:hypothetical protein